jgi:phosphoribosylglycinamide formyltransferase-1
MQPYVILISGQGSNMAALLDSSLPGHCRAVISNRPDAAGLGLAAARGIHTVVIDHRRFASRAAFDLALMAEIENHAPAWLFLAGFMRILTEEFVTHFSGRMVNIHPSLLPAFPGLHTHASALAAKVKTHGCTVHFVTPSVDGGPIIAQSSVPVLVDDTETSLAQRVLAAEHELYPRVARGLLTGQITWPGSQPTTLARPS